MAYKKTQNRVAHPYGARRDKSTTLVGRDGRQYRDKIKAFLDSIDDLGAKSQVRAMIAEAKRNKEKLTIRSVQSKLSWSNEEKFLINAGYTREQFFREYGFTFEDFEDEDNWVKDADDKSHFVWNGVAYDLVFDYSGRVLRRV